MKLSENTVLITGGASGIGLALAKSLHGNNKIIVCGRNREQLTELAKRLPGVTTYRCDLADEASLDRLVDTIRSNHPDLNMLINNAGVQHNYQFTDGVSHDGPVTEEIQTNLLAPIRLSDRLLPQLLRQDEAAIINLTSALVFAPKKSAAVYCATKSALHAFTKALRYQLEGTPVSVFEVVPSLVDTDMTRGRGTGKIAPATLAAEAIAAIARNKYQVLIGKTKMLYLLHRLFPSVAGRLLKNS